MVLKKILLKFVLFCSQQVSLDDTKLGLEESQESSELLKQQMSVMVDKFKSEKIEIEKKFIGCIDEITQQQNLLSEKELIVLHLDMESNEMKKLMQQKEKEMKRLRKIISKLNEDLDEFRSVDEKCAIVAKFIEPLEDDCQ